ncbi:MAG: hypothetical protein J5525_12090 [Lachnospiraceae bacterium]|nr:hypothetical protein [Lachnospiraceae bacterium]
MQISNFRATAHGGIEGVEFESNGYIVRIYKSFDIYTVRFTPLRRVMQPEIMFHREGSMLSFPRGSLTADNLDEFVQNVRDASELCTYVENNIDNLIARKE